MTQRWWVMLGASLLCVPSVAQAQTHPCDSTPVSITATNTNQTFTLGWCHDGKDINGQTLAAPLTWRIYRNTTLLPSTTTVVKSATANAAGLYYYTHTRSETSAGVYTFEVAAVTSAGEGARVPFASLRVDVINALPTPSVRPRIVLP